MTSFHSISQLLDELAPELENEQPAWEDVVGRAALLAPIGEANGHAREAHTRTTVIRRALRERTSPSVRSRRGLLLAGIGLLALIVVVAAAAYALGHPVIDFGTAQKGPLKVVDEFGSLQVAAPSPKMAPGVLPHQARVITTVRIDGKPHTLYVAPTTKGGFCYLWSNGLGGGCRTRHGHLAKHIGVTGFEGAHGMTLLEGSFLQAAGERLVVSYADGQTDEIPFVWVTKPINGGFYVFRVPDAHRRANHEPVAITLYDSSNKVIDREHVLGPQPNDFVAHHLPGYPPLMVPSRAIWAKRTELFAYRTTGGARLGLWIAPERGGGTCFWTNQAAGCTNAGHPVYGKLPPLNLGLEGGGKHPSLCCTVSKKITRVEARFADGDRVELTPKQGYLLWPIPPRHFPPGHRITKLIGYDDAGRKIATERMTGNQRGVYPCKKPKNYGYGVRACP